MKHGKRCLYIMISYVYTRVYVCMYLCMYLCIYIVVYIYTHNISVCSRQCVDGMFESSPCSATEDIVCRGKKSIRCSLFYGLARDLFLNNKQVPIFMFYIYCFWMRLSNRVCDPSMLVRFLPLLVV